MMETQYDLFDESGQPTIPTKPEHGAGRRNRKAALAESEPRHCGQKQKIVAHLKLMATVGATRDELAKALSMYMPSVCGRIGQLIDEGEVVETDARRNTDRGRPAVVVVHASFYGK